MKSVTAVTRETRQAFLFLVSLATSLLLIGVVVAYWVIRFAGRSEAALHREKERAEVTLSSIGDGVITTDAHGKVEYLNPVAESLTGWRTQEARGLDLEKIFLVIDEQGKTIQRSISDSKETSEDPGTVKHVRLVSRDGRETPIEDTVAPIRDRQNDVIGMVVVFHDVSHIHAMAKQLSWQASHDVLTGLANRREFERRLDELLETTTTQEKQHALLYVDLDRFKSINDTCGHIAGDEFLRQLATTLQIKIRGSDTLARIGGDEFGVLLEACPMDQAMRIANGLRETVRDFRFEWKGKTFNVGASIGLVPLDTNSGAAASVLTAADTASYDAKEKGGNRVHVFRPAEVGQSQKTAELAFLDQIHQAFEKEAFRLFRQKIIPLRERDGHAHYEVLVRMVDEAGSVHSPTSFLPTAERYNLLPILDRWVITTLISYLRDRPAGNPNEQEGNRSFYSVNLSGATINDSTFIEFLRKLLGSSRTLASRLCFEVTENTAISNLTKAAELMHELKMLGCKFSLDDFGAGMSSFVYLKHLPVDFLKIDGSFVRDMINDPMDYTIVEAINRIGHTLEMKTVAEFVEDERTLEKLRDLGVDYAQGAAVGPPEPLLMSISTEAAADTSAKLQLIASRRPPDTAQR